MTVFEELREGKSYDIRDEKYQREAHGEIDRCRHICWQINSSDPADKERIMELENELLNGQIKDGNFFTPPFQIDCANRAFLGKSVFADHGLTVMSIGTTTIEGGVMMGPEVGLFTVNHEPNNICVIKLQMNEHLALHREVHLRLKQRLLRQGCFRLFRILPVYCGIRAVFQ